MPPHQSPDAVNSRVTPADPALPTLSNQRLKEIAQAAGERILAVYNSGFDVTLKADESPVTLADQQASAVITQALSALSPWPVLSEENHIPTWTERQQWPTYWLVDPLDGTKEFIKKNGDFSVNIALIHHHQPIQGMIYAPVSGEFWWACRGEGAWYANATAPTPTRMQVVPLPAQLDDWQVLLSRSWQSERSRHFRATLGVPKPNWAAVGSSLKMCHIAQGKAHLYARLGPTSEWDTGAAQIILEEAGGLLLNADTGQAMRYNEKKSLLNPWFVATSARDNRWANAITETRQWAKDRH